jgi:hypothetical protein
MDTCDKVLQFVRYDQEGEYGDAQPQSQHKMVFDKAVVVVLEAKQKRQKVSNFARHKLGRDGWDILVHTRLGPLRQEMGINNCNT